ncbi:MAG TPA: hypothetical protein VFB09_02255, partial [Actinomycetota bacterium]|nr:hypothetical protein [Actinomycetota bacterium]
SDDGMHLHVARLRGQRRMLRPGLHLSKRSELLPAEEHELHDEQPVLLELLPRRTLQVGSRPIQL